MSWLKEKLFGPKPRLGSCSNLEIFETQGNSNAQYCQAQLKNFIERGQELKTFIMGYEVVSDVASFHPGKVRALQGGSLRSRRELRHRPTL